MLHNFLFKLDAIKKEKFSFRTQYWDRSLASYRNLKSLFSLRTFQLKWKKKIFFPVQYDRASVLRENKHFTSL
jgi:hypothetical protein